MDWLYQFRRHLFGDCPPNLVGIHLSMTPIGRTETTRLLFDIQIQPHSITLPDGMRLNRFGVKQKHQSVVSNVGLTKPDFVLDQVHFHLKQNSTVFRESDPRIGSSGVLRSFPLLDLGASPEPSTHCHLCGCCQDDTTMWGGWNLLWVHQSCWSSLNNVVQN